MDQEDMDPSESAEQSSQHKFKTTSLCYKMKCDAFNENEDTKEKNLIVIHEMYQCSKCYEVYDEESALNDHACILRLNTNNVSSPQTQTISTTTSVNCKLMNKRIYDCDKCDLCFTEKNLLREHRQTHKSRCIQFSCKTCSLEFSDKDSFIRHNRRCEGKWFKCNQCGKKFNNENRLNCHIQKQHILPKAPPECKLCEKTFSSVRAARVHKILVHLKSLPKLFTCEVCNASFPFKASLKDHSVVHSEERPHMCEKCGKTYKRKKHLTLHINCVHSEGRPLMCDKCGKTFKSKTNLAKHFKSHQNPFKCDKCGKCYKWKHNFKNHSCIQTRINNKLYQCEVCSKSFGRERAFINHMLVHSERTFSCDKCNKRYVHYNNFQKHLKTHDNTYAISCDICNQKFYCQTNLLAHAVVHTKEKLYECEHCHKQFSNKRNLSKHNCSQGHTQSSVEILLSLMAEGEAS